MIIEQLRLRGLSTAFPHEIAIDFSKLPRGIYAFVGSNGLGKTTALEALMPGTLYRHFPSYNESLMQKATRRDAFAELVFKLDHGRGLHRVLVKTDPQYGGRGKTEAYWYTDVIDAAPAHSWQPMTSEILAEFDAYRAQHLPSLELLLAGPFCAQRVRHQNGSLLSLPKGEKKALFAELLALHALQHRALAARERARVATEAIDKDQAAIAELEALGGRAAEVAARHDQLAEQRSAIHAANVLAGEQLKAKQDQVESTRLALDTVVAEQIGPERTLHRLDGQRGELEARRAEWQTKHKRAQQVMLRRTEIAAAVQETESITGTVASIAEEIADWQQTSEILTRDAGEHNTKARAWHTELLALGREKLALERDLATALELCDRCPFGGAELDAKKARAAQVPAEILTADDNRQREDRMAVDCETKRGTFVTLAKDATTQRIKLWNRLNELAPLRDLAAALERASEDATEAGAMLATITAQLEQIVRDSTTLREECEAWAKRHAALKLELVKANDAQGAADHVVQSFRRQLADLDAALAAADQDIKQQVELEGRLGRRRTQLAAHQAEVDVWKLLERSLGPDGLQALHIELAGPQVGGLANELLHQTFGTRFSLAFETVRPVKRGKGVQEVFDIRILDSEQDRDQAQGSGGETVWIETALRLALMIYVTRQTGKDLRTLCLDEPASGLSADVAPLYTSMLRHALTLGDFHHAFFISHQEEVWGGADGFLCFRRGQDPRWAFELEEARRAIAE